MKNSGYLAIALVALVLMTGCAQAVTSASPGGTNQVVSHVAVNKDGMTVEQDNIAHRLYADNEIGAIKHLYLISPYNNRVIYYSTVSGKVTSSGKRLNPISVAITDYSNGRGLPFNHNGYEEYTPDVMNDDGSYGTASEYIYWWDTKGIYHQLYVGSGILIITSEPININSGTTISVENVK